MTDVLIEALYIFKDIAALTGIFMVMRFIFLEKSDFKFYKILSVLLLISVNGIAGMFYLKNMTADFDSVMDFISDVISLIFIFVVFGTSSWLRKIITYFIFIYSCDMVWALISPVFGKNLIAEYITHIVLFLIFSISVYVYCEKINDNNLPMIFGRVPSFVYLLILGFELTCYFREYGESKFWYDVMYTVSSAGIIVCVLYVLLMVFRISYEQVKIAEQLKVQSEQIERVQEGDEELRRFRHDYKNHMIAVGSLIESGRTAEAREYLKSVTGQTDEYLDVIKTGNFTADAIINSKATSGKDKGIIIDFTGFIPPDGINNKDICTVLSNLLDNAIEAVEKVNDKKIITIEANMSYGNFILSISNYAENVRTDKEGKIVTSKADRKNHGIGLRNVERTIEKYKGALLTEFADGIFTVDLRMKIR